MVIATEHNSDTTVTQYTHSGTLLGALEAIRTRDGQSVPEFADRIGISYQMLAAIRRGDRQPGPRTLSSILSALPETVLVVVAYMQSRGRPRRQAAPAAVDNTGEGASPPALPRR